MQTPVYTAHPWHGVEIGPDQPQTVTAFIEIVPSDTIKYEIDKSSGLMKIDRPQKFSSLCPTLYGFVPRTYCSKNVAHLANDARVERGDGDPLDICVFTERSIIASGFLVRARPIGGFRLIDKKEADDKIIAVMADDPLYAHVQTLSDMPAALVDRLRHYFLTYKEIASSNAPIIEIGAVYERDTAHAVIAAAIRDYEENFRHA